MALVEPRAEEQPPRPGPVSPPLADVRILSLEQFGAGPWGTVHLADLGAEIIKIEDPRSRGDVGRYVPPFQEGEDSLFFETFSHNKRSISLDLSKPEARPVFEELVRASDAVFSNLRGDAPAKLRIRYEDLRAVNPAIVCCSLSGFGMTGPRAAQPGYDYILQGYAGWMSLTGDPDGPPSKTGLSLVDMTGGYVAALSLMTALWRARRDGVGCDCDVSLFETALNLNMYLATWHLSRGWQPERMKDSAHPSVVPFQNFRTSDGWIVLGCAKDKFFDAAARTLGLGWMVDDERFSTMAARLEHRDACLAEMSERLASESTEHWLTRLGAAGVPCGPVNDLAQAVVDPQTIARDLIAETEHPRLGTVRQIRSPLRMEGSAEELRPAPARGEHTRQVLLEHGGCTEQRISELAELGVFGDVSV
jgi:crotonobetainyl-CoA:carnitine CoA-transferase CaiB-like acyl-CoA transferase